MADHALLIGTKHLRTFDGNIYSLSTNCSLLLAKDFVNDAFTVILNQDGNGLRSLHMDMNGTSVMIYPEQKVREFIWACSNLVTRGQLKHSIGDSCYTYRSMVGTVELVTWNSLPFNQIYQKHNISRMENCQILDMPLKESGVTIQKELDNIAVSSTNGVRFSCDLRYNLCKLNLDGWHHGE